MTLALVWVLAFAAVPAEVSAATPAPVAERPGRALFERAEANFNIGKFAEALADYRAAYEAEPLPAFLFNIGQCYRNMGDYESAGFYFRRYTVLAPRGSHREVAERLIAEMSERAEPPRPSPALPSLAATTGSAGAVVGQDPFAPALRQSRDTPATPPVSRPLHRRAWFWIGLTAVAASGIAVGLVLSRDDPQGTLPSIDARVDR
jgi:hypothetical protein